MWAPSSLPNVASPCTFGKLLFLQEPHFPHLRKREEIPAMILEACHVMPEQHL